MHLCITTIFLFFCLSLNLAEARLGSSSCDDCIDIDLSIDRPSSDQNHLVMKGDTITDTGVLVMLEEIYQWLSWGLFLFNKHRLQEFSRNSHQNPSNPSCLISSRFYFLRRFLQFHPYQRQRLYSIFQR